MQIKAKNEEDTIASRPIRLTVGGIVLMIAVDCFMPFGLYPRLC